jgi:hypothetical protein
MGRNFRPTNIGRTPIVLGRVVVTAEESEPLIDWRIPIPDHPSGAYIFTILTENKVFTYKLAMLR